MSLNFRGHSTTNHDRFLDLPTKGTSGFLCQQAHPNKRNELDEKGMFAASISTKRPNAANRGEKT